MSSSWMKMAPAWVLMGCFAQSLPTPPPPAQGPADDLGPLADLPATDLLAAVEAEYDVPADLLAALAFVETGFGAFGGADDRIGYLALDADERAAADRLGAPDPGRRAGNLVAGALLLDDLRATVAPDADELDAAWFPVVTAWSDAPEPWQRDLFAREVFGVLQAGLVAATDRMAVAPDDDEVVVLAPRVIPGLQDVSLAPEPSLGAPEYPGALALHGSPNTAPRPGGGNAVQRIAVRALPGSYASALAAALTPGGESAHYVVSRIDGATRQLAAEAWALDGEDPAAVVLGIAGPADHAGTWTVQAMEGSATAAAWLAYRYQLPITEQTFAVPGGDFPAVPWMNLVACIAAGEADCDPVAGTPGAPARSEERSISVPYFYQYANSLHPGASCQNTSIAMVLSKYGWTGNPDTITSRFGKDRAQSPAGLADVFNTLAQEAGISARLTANTSGSRDRLHQLLAAGKPVIVHGYFTGYGHVLVATGYDGSHYTANDPAGRWAQAWKGGYPYGYNSAAGRGIRYPRAAFDQAIATSNGSSYLPLWFHELSGVGGDGPADDTPPADSPSDPEDPPSDPEDVPAPEAPEAPDDPAPGSFPWADVEFLTPGDGDSVGNPTVLRAERHGGEAVSFWAGPYRVSDDLTPNPAAATVTFHQPGPRTLTARSHSTWGTVLASDTINVEVAEAPGDPTDSEGCAVVGAIACGETVSGSTVGATNFLSGYPNAVGNWAGPEVGYTWTGTGGEVEISLVDVDHDLVDHDILILEDDGLSCQAANQLLVAFNSLVFEASAGKNYTFVVDGFSGDSGPYRMHLDCDP